MRRRLALILLLLAAAVVSPEPGLGAVWRVYGESMEPTIEDGSIVVVDHLQPRVSGYRRGDIVILSPPGWSEGFPLHTLIKRVIALPGERVRVDNGRVTVDGRALDEPYLPEAVALTALDGPPLETVVPPGRVFVLGDHRGNSLDSTSFGAVSVDDLHGRVVLIVSGRGVALPVVSPLPGTVQAGD